MPIWCLQPPCQASWAQTGFSSPRLLLPSLSRPRIPARLPTAYKGGCCYFFFPLLFPHPSAKIKKKKKKKPLGTEREGRGRGNTANSRPQNFVESTNVGETLPPESQCERLRLQQPQHRTGDSGASERAETPPNKQKRRPLHRAAIAAHCRGAEERSFPGVSLCLPSSGSGAVYPTPRTLRTETKPSRAPLPTPRSGAAKPRVARYEPPKGNKQNRPGTWGDPSSYREAAARVAPRRDRGG